MEGVRTGFDADTSIHGTTTTEVIFDPHRR
jgi:hypothetical protein